MNTNPIYNKFASNIHIKNEIQTEKHVIHENNLRKNLVLKDLVKERLTKRYSI
jgi:hypothetical protein